MLAFVIGPNAVSGKPDNPQSKQASDGDQYDSDRHSHAVSPPSPAHWIGKLSFTVMRVRLRTCLFLQAFSR